VRNRGDRFELLHGLRAVRVVLLRHRLVGRLHGWARLAIAGYLAGGRATVTALRRADGDVLSTVPKPSRARTAWYALRILLPAISRRHR